MYFIYTYPRDTYIPLYILVACTQWSRIYLRPIFPALAFWPGCAGREMFPMFLILKNRELGFCVFIHWIITTWPESHVLKWLFLSVMFMFGDLHNFTDGDVSCNGMSAISRYYR